MKKHSNAKTNMLIHSKAKVELYANYFATYLTILSRVSFIERIYLYDLMCGEGLYEDGFKGSPIVAMEKIRAHYFSNKEAIPNLEILFNDKDKSKIERNKYKIDRVKEVCANIHIPNNVNVYFKNEDYSKIYHEVIKKLIGLSNDERALVFLDPYGYKEIMPNHLREFLSNGKTELILFLPISYMYRFAKKSLRSNDFPGGIPLQEFLTPLIKYNYEINEVNSPYDFISQLKESFKRFLNKYSIFVDTFTIERDSQNIYCLFFFTPHILGFEKMLETKWKIDEQQGRGFRLNKEQESLFTEIEMSSYSDELKDFILQGKGKTNSDLYIFGLRKGFLPKHTKHILKDWQDNNSKFKVYLSNGKEARKNSFYISYKNYGNNPRKIVKYIFE